MREIELHPGAEKVIERVRRSRFYVILYTADYGCVECDILEELMEKDGLEDLLDLKVIITHDEDSVEMALDMGITAIPWIVVGRGGSEEVINDPDPYIQYEKLREALKGRIELYQSLLHYYTEHARELSRQLGFEVEVNPKIIPLVIKNIEEYGKPYCPCRVAKTDKEVCPCAYHIDELKRFGHCKCGLFTRRRV